jgi:ABC-type multidrug transport system fused ATPase/permease subunit
MIPMHPLATLWSLLTPGQRRRFVVLQVVSTFMAISTVLGLAGVMAFLAVLANPALIEAHAVLRWYRDLLDTTQRNLTLALGGAFVLLLLASALLNVLGLRAMGRFAFSVGDRMRELLFTSYLRRGYLFHARSGAARLIDNVLYQADRVTITFLYGQVLLTNVVLTLLVIASIAIVNPWLALVGGVGVGGSYYLFFRTIRARIERNGRLQSELGAERVAVVEHAFHGIKHLLVAGAQQSFATRFASVMRAMSQASADIQFVGQFPRYVLECLAGVGLIASAALVAGGDDGGAWLGQLGFIAFAGFRLLPAFQQMYSALVIVRANRSAIEELALQLAGSQVATPLAEPSPGIGRPALRRAIELSEVSFRYAPEAPLILAGASLRIPAGAAVAVVGASGCGKTTLVDVILGLLTPVAGRIELDGVPLEPGCVADWHRCVGYVPQDVIILDASIRENIAFGIEPGQIDDARVRAAARDAGATGFIESLAGGFDARISGGGRGLSGGQRQRIGIARALYGEPSLLVLDEATNSLDADTERAVIDAVVRNRGSRTVVVVAHAAAVIAACDQVHELHDGRLELRTAPRPARSA